MLYLFGFLLIGSIFFNIDSVGALSLDLSNRSSKDEVEIIPVATPVYPEHVESFFKEIKELFQSNFSSFQENYATSDKKQLDINKVKSACEAYLAKAGGTSSFTLFLEDENDLKVVKFNEEFSKLNSIYMSKQGTSSGESGIIPGAIGSIFDGINKIYPPSNNNHGNNDKNNTSNNNSFLNQVDDCRKELLGEEFADVLQTAFTAIKVVVPILMIVLIMKDFITAVAAGKEEDMKKAQANAIKRLIIGVVIFLLPTIVNLILGLIGLGSGTCGIS